MFNAPMKTLIDSAPICKRKKKPYLTDVFLVLQELIYRSIKEEPFKIPNETYDDLMYTFFSPTKEGWLMKQGGRYVLIGHFFLL